MAFAKLTFTFGMLLCCLPMAVLGYDPLKLPDSAASSPAPLDLTIQDTARNREIPVRVYLPAGKEAAPVVLFSHGLGGNREGSAYLGKHWSARGYAVVYLQHHGSDDAVWKNAGPGEGMKAMGAAVNVQNVLLRVKDVSVALDQLAKWNDDKGNALAGRLDMKHVGMSGHSFGAVTTQAVSGQQASLGKGFTDERIRAAVIMSPGAPKRDTAEHAFGSVKLPWMLMTGTKDVAPVGHQDMASRLAVYPALPAGDKYELVLDNAEHSAFTDRPLPGDSQARNPNHHRVILALSTAFWDAYLKNNSAAREWLQGPGPREVMQEKDRWQKK